MMTGDDAPASVVISLEQKEEKRRDEAVVELDHQPRVRRRFLSDVGAKASSDSPTRTVARPGLKPGETGNVKSVARTLKTSMAMKTAAAASWRDGVKRAHWTVAPLDTHPRGTLKSVSSKSKILLLLLLRSCRPRRRLQPIVYTSSSSPTPAASSVLIRPSFTHRRRLPLTLPPPPQSSPTTSSSSSSYSRRLPPPLMEPLPAIALIEGLPVFL
ncbi:uncharacterized protein A4U43_C04F10830 [Asparagus officinalis]|uniref:Uncharacterized protein n=1 Tax=Asparagus officinalis TaxID=4686 RepID=A0A5P1F0D4_ASPOF|nr:uncharacterized protein A4U43_C04F10830 [Asparagus officinalis]